jgi:hypothetical protein
MFKISSPQIRPLFDMHNYCNTMLYSLEQISSSIISSHVGRCPPLNAAYNPMMRSYVGHMIPDNGIRTRGKFKPTPRFNRYRRRANEGEP